jgi:hypothetical protein
MVRKRALKGLKSKAKGNALGKMTNGKMRYN